MGDARVCLGLATSLCTLSSTLHLQAICQPEMKKNKTYKLNLALNSEALHIMSANCGCPGRKGPNDSCKHIAMHLRIFAH